MFAMAVHPETGIVTYANAGHEEPLLLGEEPSYLDVMSGIALGLFEDSDIVEEKLVLRGGEGLLLYTDGFTEAINTEKQQYGKERLRETASGEYRKCIAAFVTSGQWSAASSRPSVRLQAGWSSLTI